MKRALIFVFIISTFLVGFGVVFWVSLFACLSGFVFHKNRLFKSNRKRMVAKTIFYITITIYCLLNDYYLHRK